MTRVWLTVVGTLVALAVIGPRPAQAQVIGTFRWQLLPYCNVVTLTVVQTGANYALQGIDDQCGGLRSGVTGVAFAEPALAQITLSFTTVSVPTATALHSQASISLASLGGTWRDDLGRTGPFTFTPGPPVAAAQSRPITKRVSIGSMGASLTLAAGACAAREVVGGIAASVREGDTLHATPQTLPAGVSVVPMVAGSDGRFTVLFCNGSSSPTPASFMTVALDREPK
jgi:hypothetical protein